MTINLTLPPDVEQRVISTAKSLNLPVEEYILSLVASVHPKIQPAPLAGESEEDFIKAMKSLSETSNPVRLPYTTWTRAEIYQDHD